MADSSDASAPRPRRRRLFVAVLALVLLAGLAIRVVLTVYAADIFVAALGRALAGSGAEVVFAEPPTVSFEGFRARGVVLRSLAGEEWGSADAASGSAHLLFHAPYVSVALELEGARTKLPSSGKASTKGAPNAPALDVSLPVSLASVKLRAAAVDLGQGRMLTLSASVAGDGRQTRVEIERLDYSEPSGESAGEKISGTIVLTPVASAAPKLDLTVHAGAALAGTVLFDFATHPLSFAASVEEAKGALGFRDATFALGKLIGGTGSFAVEGGALASADVRLVSGDLEPAFATLVREPFAGVVPALAGSELRGRGEIEIEMREPSRHRASANVTLTLESLRTRSVDAAGLSVELPWIGAEQQDAKDARSGRLRAKSVTLLGLTWSGIDVPLEASKGKLRSRSVQEWKSAGGTMRVTGLAYDDDASKGPRLSGDVELDGFDVAALGKAFGWERLSGSLSGNLGRVVIDGDAVRASGSVETKAWGGTVTLSKLFVEDPFGRVPELGLDAEVRDVQLEEMTAAFGLGRVTGVLEGHIHGLVVADGQPQAFDADLHTVDRRRVSQTIDVRAIAQLGALGGDTGSLTGSLLKVIDRYRYSAMGIRCRLRNDVFEIRGVESRGGRDYLVKGSLLPPSVSVVSHSQVISFSEMLRRIERISAIGEGGTPDAEPRT